MPRPISGRIPQAGSGSAASFTRRRVNAFLRLGRISKPAEVLAICKQLGIKGTWDVNQAGKPFVNPSMVPESRWRFIPKRSRRNKGNATIGKGTTHRGRSGKLWSSAGSRPEGPGWREVGGARAFPAFGLLPSITAGAQLGLATRYDPMGKKRQLIAIQSMSRELSRLLAIAGLPHIGARFIVWHVGRWCLMEIVDKTPIDKGLAAAGWTISPQLRGTGKGYGRVGFRISSDVEYIKFLEYGHQGYPPQSMMRSTFMQARAEIRNVQDVLVEWWKIQQVTLRNLKFDQTLRAGVLAEDIESKIPNMSWQRLNQMLNDRLPLKNVSELNASAALAYRIDDPKDWHSVDPEWQPRDFRFEAYKVSQGKKWIEPGVMDEKFDIEHVRLYGENPIPTPSYDLAAQAKELEAAWNKSFAEPPNRKLGPIGSKIAAELEAEGPTHVKGPMAEQFERGMPGDTGRRWYRNTGKHAGEVEYK